MTKETLIQYIQNMNLEEDFESLLLQQVDEASVVDDLLLNKIADILDAQAEFLEESADILDAQADISDDLDADLKNIDEQEETARAEALLKNQQTLINELNGYVNEVNGKDADEGKIDQIQQELIQQMEQMQQPVSLSPNQDISTPPQPPVQTEVPVQASPQPPVQTEASVQNPPVDQPVGTPQINSPSPIEG